MKVLISGGSGFLGSALSRLLLVENHQVWVLTRGVGNNKFVSGVTPVKWDGCSTLGWLDVFEQIDAVVNLAGATIGSWPWHAARKKEIIQSRVNAGQAITQAFEQASRRPSVLIQASGVGYYGHRDSTPVNEQTTSGNDYLAQVAVQFEQATETVERLGVRRVVIRSGIVLDAKGGSLPLMALPIRLFIGGRLGAGTQGFPWIHLRDEIRAILYLMQNESAQGVFNLTSPNLVSSDEFMKTLAKTINRPYWFPMPAFLLRTVLGGMADLLLNGQFAQPTRLLEAGYQLQFLTLSDALKEIYS